MRIRSVRIRNFRSLMNVEVEVQDYTSLIGRNDSGKSSFLRALRLLFDPDCACDEGDKCAIPNEGDECFVEAVLEPTTACNDPGSDSTVRIRRLLDQKARWEKLDKVPKQDIFRQMLTGKLTKQAYASNPAATGEVKAAVGDLPPGQVKATDWQDAFCRCDSSGLVEYESGWCEMDPEDLRALVRPVVLEADVKAEDEVADKGASIFSRIGGLLVQEAIQRHVGLQGALNALKKEITAISERDADGRWSLEDLNNLQTMLQEEISGFDSAVKVSTNLQPPKLPAVSFGVSLDVADEWATGLENLGHGLRRSLVFAMLRTLRRLREIGHVDVSDGSPEPDEPLYLFLIEEPELYLHPQAERQRMRELLSLSSQPSTQVLLCTHSAFFVDLNQYRGILRFDRPDRRATCIRAWQGADLDPLDKKTLDTTYHFDPSRAAMLFADLVILVEGQTERVTVPALADRLGLPTAGVELVDCGGNSYIPLYQRVLEEFGVKYVAWLDDDCKSEVEKARAIRTTTTGRIVLTDKDWEHMAGLTGDKDKPYRSWLKYVHNGEEPNDAMKDRIRAAYGWRDFPVETSRKREDEALDGLSI